MRTIVCAAMLFACGCTELGDRPPEDYDVILQGGTIYDGGGGAPLVGDVACAATGSRPSAISPGRAPHACST
jgi:hypothetical protein